MKRMIKNFFLMPFKLVLRGVFFLLLPYLIIFVLVMIVVLSIFGAAPQDAAVEKEKGKVISLVKQCKPEVRSKYRQEEDFTLDWGIVYAVEMYAGGWNKIVDRSRVERIIDGLKTEFSYREYVEKTNYYDENNHLYREIKKPIRLLIEVHTYKGRYLFSYKEKRDITYFYVSRGEEVERHIKENIYLVPAGVEFYEDYYKLDMVLLSEIKDGILGFEEIVVDGGKFVWPLPSGRTITSEYGYRFHPVDKVYKLHTGIDIAADTGDDVVAAAEGIVVFTGLLGGYGKSVILQHSGNIQTLYAHNSKNIVKRGEIIEKGQKIAEAGSTGKSTGPHLHFEVRVNGRPVNPLGGFHQPGGIFNVVDPVDRKMILETASAFMEGKSSLKWLKQDDF